MKMPIPGKTDEVREALDEIFRSFDLQTELTKTFKELHQRAKYSNVFIPLIEIEDPNGLLDDKKS
jgi:hypothetical protein